MEETEVIKMYNRLREPFTRFLVSKFGSIAPTVIDKVYNASFVKLHSTIREGKLTSLDTTYLFSVGKNQLKKHYREQNKKDFFNFVDVLPDVLDEPELIDEVQIQKCKIVTETINKLGGNCAQVLYSFYREGKSMQEIANELNYKNEDVVKTKKKRCTNSLKTMLIEKFIAEDVPCRLKPVKNEEDSDIKKEKVKFKSNEELAAEWIIIENDINKHNE